MTCQLCGDCTAAKREITRTIYKALAGMTKELNRKPEPEPRKPVTYHGVTVNTHERAERMRQ